MLTATGGTGIGHCKRILVVDDHVESAELLREYLATFGGPVRIAHDGATALRIADEFEPHLALIDIGLDEHMDGYMLARKLRERARDRQLHIVALTGYRRDHTREQSELVVFDAHLLKPVSGERLAKVLHEVCASDHARGDVQVFT